MKTALPLAALISLSLAGSPAHAVTDDVALIKNVTGAVHVVRDGCELAATPGTGVRVSDELQSERGASAGIVFRDGTLVTLGASSRLKVRDYVFDPKEAHYAFSVYLAKGQAIYASGKIGKIAPESVKVDTPTSTVGVRGTRFVIVAQ